MGTRRVGNTPKRVENDTGGNDSENNGIGNAIGGDADADPAAAAAPAAAPASTGTADEGDNAPVNPAAIAPDDFERDEFGNVVLGKNGQPKKKRGRKSGSAVAGANSSGGNSKPKTTAATTPKQRVAVATEMLAAQFQILNTGIAFLTKFDDFKLSDSEAMQMADATSNVMAQFDYVPDPKISAVIGLVTTASMIYGPRVYLYRKKVAANNDSKKEAKIAAADERAATGFQYNLGDMSG